MFWPVVKAGDKFTPSAMRENQISHLLNSTQMISGSDNVLTFNNNNVVNVINQTDNVIPAYTAVTVSKSIENINDNKIISVQPSTSGNALWGITESAINPGTFGSMVVSGVAQAFIVGTGEYASPGADGKLVVSNVGTARILHPGTAEVPGFVLLGGSGTGSKEYNGPFTVRRIPDDITGGTFDICYGKYADRPTDYMSTICGYVDLPNVGAIPRQIFKLDESEGGADIYLCACFKDGKYSVIFDNQKFLVAKDQGMFDNVLIAEVYRGFSPEQFEQPEKIMFSREWFL